MKAIKISEHIALFDYPLTTAGRVLHALPGGCAPGRPGSKQRGADYGRTDPDDKQDNAYRIDVEPVGADGNGIFQDRADHDKDDPEANKSSSSSPVHIYSFRSGACH
jgi:hypothetical protein